MGRKLVLTGTKLTDLTAPKLATIDVILPEAGALAFFDPTHPTSQWGTFDLNSTATLTLPNLAYTQALAMYPSGTTATLSGGYNKGAGMLNDGTSSKIERTGKGGLHAIFSQTVGDSTSTTRNLGVFAGSGTNAYILANKTHSFYFAYWGRITRPHKYPSGAPVHAQGNGANDLFAFYTRPIVAETQYPTTAARIGNYQEGAQSIPANTTNLPIFQDVAISSSPAASVGVTAFKPWAQVGNTLDAASMIFYGFYAEDLTVSGRTYAQVNALVKAKYEKDVKTVGGRYYADTFTAPSTIP